MTARLIQFKTSCKCIDIIKFARYGKFKKMSYLINSKFVKNRFRCKFILQHSYAVRGEKRAR